MPRKICALQYTGVSNSCTAIYNSLYSRDRPYLNVTKNVFLKRIAIQHTDILKINKSFSYFCMHTEMKKGNISFNGHYSNDFGWAITVCPRSSDSFYIVIHYIKWVTTSWTQISSYIVSIWVAWWNIMSTFWPVHTSVPWLYNISTFRARKKMIFFNFVSLSKPCRTIFLFSIAPNLESWAKDNLDFYRNWILLARVVYPDPARFRCYDRIRIRLFK